MENNDTTELLNAVEIDPENEITRIETNPDENNNIHDPEYSGNGNLWQIFSASIYSLVQILIGGSVSVTLWFAFKSTPVSAFDLHIGLSVIGYQLLTAHGLLSLQGHGWSSLTLRHRRRVHWVLQLVGSATAIAGSVIMIREKTEHFNTWHGKLALAALIFTCASLINGIMSLYSTELRHLISVRIPKISHILFGTTSFILSSVALAFGYNKGSFKEWASEEFAYVMIGIVAFYTFVLVTKPCFTLINKIFFCTECNIC